MQKDSIEALRQNRNPLIQEAGLSIIIIIILLPFSIYSFLLLCGE